MTVVRGALAGLAVLAVASGCSLDICAEHAPAFELGIRLDDELESPVASFEARVRWDEYAYARHFIVDGALDDGRTSIGIELSPPPEETVDVTVEVIGRNGVTETSTIVGRGKREFDVSPDGCNEVEIEISPLEDRS